MPREPTFKSYKAVKVPTSPYSREASTSAPSLPPTNGALPKTTWRDSNDVVDHLENVAITDEWLSEFHGPVDAQIEFFEDERREHGDQLNPAYRPLDHQLMSTDFSHASGGQLPSLAAFNEEKQKYLDALNSSKRDKAVCSREKYFQALRIFLQPKETRNGTAQFRFWARKTFKLHQTSSGKFMLLQHNRPVALEDQMYGLLCMCHTLCSHGGRDKTSVSTRAYFSYIPKDIMGRFVKICPLCQSKKHGPRMLLDNGQPIPLDDLPYLRNSDSPDPIGYPSYQYERASTPRKHESYDERDYDASHMERFLPPNPNPTFPSFPAPEDHYEPGPPINYDPNQVSYEHSGHGFARPPEEGSGWLQGHHIPPFTHTSYDDDSQPHSFDAIESATRARSDSVSPLPEMSFLSTLRGHDLPRASIVSCPDEWNHGVPAPTHHGFGTFHQPPAYHRSYTGDSISTVSSLGLGFNDMRRSSAPDPRTLAMHAGLVASSSDISAATSTSAHSPDPGYCALPMPQTGSYEPRSQMQSLSTSVNVGEEGSQNLAQIMATIATQPAWSAEAHQ